MKFTNTAVFVARLAPMDAEIAEIASQLSQLAGTIEAKKAANALVTKKKDLQKYGAEERSLKTLQKRLQELQDKRHQLHTELPRSAWSLEDLIRMLIEAKGNEWNEREQELGAVERADYEGKFENAYRSRKGWELGGSLECMDFPQIRGEGKYFGSLTDMTFRTGKYGKQTYGRMYRVLTRMYREEELPEEVWSLFEDGEVSQGKVHNSLPEAIRKLIQETLAPEKVLGVYDVMVFLTDHGFLEVESPDYTKAISLVAITQMGPRYRLKREYVENQLLATLNEPEPTVEVPVAA